MESCTTPGISMNTVVITRSFALHFRECAVRYRPCSVPTQSPSLTGPIRNVEKENKTLSLKFRVPKMCWSESLHFLGILATALQSGITEIVRNRDVRICSRLKRPWAQQLHCANLVRNKQYCRPAYATRLPWTDDVNIRNTRLTRNETTDWPIPDNNSFSNELTTQSSGILSEASLLLPSH
jgi:hypothetical protein